MGFGFFWLGLSIFDYIGCFMVIFGEFCGFRKGVVLFLFLSEVDVSCFVCALVV